MFEGHWLLCHLEGMQTKRLLFYIQSQFLQNEWLNNSLLFFAAVKTWLTSNVQLNTTEKCLRMVSTVLQLSCFHNCVYNIELWALPRWSSGQGTWLLTCELGDRIPVAAAAFSMKAKIRFCIRGYIRNLLQHGLLPTLNKDKIFMQLKHAAPEPSFNTCICAKTLYTGMKNRLYLRSCQELLLQVCSKLKQYTMVNLNQVFYMTTLLYD